MRTKFPLLPAAILALATAAWCVPAPAQSQFQAQPSATQKDQKPDPMVEAARRAKQQQKSESKPAKVFTNDDIPTRGGISTVGEASAPATPASDGKSAKSANAAAGNSDNGEQTWRKKFADLRQKLQQDQADLDVMQRELGVLSVQQYDDPMKAMQQQLSRDDINKKTAAIDAKKKEIAADQQAISDAEEDLRKSGGDSGWAR